MSNQINPYIALHVRRGDRLKLNRRYDKHTQSENIARILFENLNQVQNVFLMSDEQTPGFFDPLKEKFSIFTYLDFPEISKLVKDALPDNFLLFCVEKKSVLLKGLK